jgi:hypothetical protein
LSESASGARRPTGRRPALAGAHRDARRVSRRRHDPSALQRVLGTFSNDQRALERAGRALKRAAEAPSALSGSQTMRASEGRRGPSLAVMAGVWGVGECTCSSPHRVAPLQALMSCSSSPDAQASAFNASPHVLCCRSLSRPTARPFLISRASPPLSCGILDVVNPHIRWQASASSSPRRLLAACLPACRPHKAGTRKVPAMAARRHAWPAAADGGAECEAPRLLLSRH